MLGLILVLLILHAIASYTSQEGIRTHRYSANASKEIVQIQPLTLDDRGHAFENTIVMKASDPLPETFQKVWNELPMGSLLWYSDHLTALQPDWIRRASASGGLVFGLHSSQKDIPRNVFQALNISEVETKNLCRLSARSFFIHKQETTLKFFDDWLAYSQKSQSVSKSDSECVSECVFSLLAYKQQLDIEWPQLWF